MRYLYLVVLICACGLVKAQYYYNDIVAPAVSNQQYLLLKNNKVKQVSASSFESNNQPTDNFQLDQRISPDAKTITLFTSYPSSGASLTTNIYDSDRLVKTIDSSLKVVTITDFKYDTEGRIQKVLTQTRDTFMNSYSEEWHEWIYSNGRPSLMLRIKDKTDTTRVEFTLDEEQNVAQETWKRKGTTVQTYYYYYNDKKQLTDIVRYNSRAKKLLPDFLFEYDNEGRITQMTQVPSGNNNYLVWKYVYNEKGLKQREVLFNKQNELIGRIEYQYQ